MKHYKICIIIICSFCCSIVSAQHLSKRLDLLFDEGKSLYEEQKYANATEVFSQLIDLGKSQKNTHLLSKIYYKLGVFYDQKKNHTKALDCFFKGTNIVKSQLTKTRSSILVPNVDSNGKISKNHPSKEAEIICNLYNRIGGVYYNQENYQKAEKYWKVAFSMAKQNSQSKALSSILNNLGEINRLKGDLQGALPLYKEALDIKQSIGDSSGMNVNLSNIGAIYLQLEQPDSAKLFYDQSYDLAQQTQTPQVIVTSYMDYARYYQSIKQASLAAKWSKKALGVKEIYDDLNVMLSIYQQLSQIYEAQNRLDSCLFFQKKWIALNKTINKEENVKLALEIEAKFLMSEKEKELNYLKLEQQYNQFKDYFQWAFILGLFGILAFTLAILRLRNKKNKKLADNLVYINLQNKEKDLLLKEIHHRVKNNLQVITSLLSLQSYNISDAVTKELFSQSQHRINSMAMIHEMLYQSDDLSKINYKNYLNQLVEKLVNSFKGEKHQIQIELDVPELFLNLDTAIPLGLLINEIITNALKYGIPNDNTGTLSLKMQILDAPNFLLNIGDNGVGYVGDFKSQKHSSLGLRLIQQLTIQLNGSIEKDLTKTGTHYTLRFQEIEAAP